MRLTRHARDEPIHAALDSDTTGRAVAVAEIKTSSNRSSGDVHVREIEKCAALVGGPVGKPVANADPILSDS